MNEFSVTAAPVSRGRWPESVTPGVAPGGAGAVETNHHPVWGVSEINEGTGHDVSRWTANRPGAPPNTSFRYPFHGQLKASVLSKADYHVWVNTIKVGRAIVESYILRFRKKGLMVSSRMRNG